MRDVEALSPAARGHRVVLDEAQAIKNPANDTAQQLRRIPADSRIALTGTPIENGLGDLWAILDFTNPGLLGSRATFVSQLSGDGESALHALNGILVFRRTKTEPEVAAELPDRIDELDHCTMSAEQIGLYQAVLDRLVQEAAEAEAGGERKQGAILAAITALKQICNHPSRLHRRRRSAGGPLRQADPARGDRRVGVRRRARRSSSSPTSPSGASASPTTSRTRFGIPVSCYHGGLARGARDKMVAEFQEQRGRRRAGAVAQGRRHRPQPHRRQPRRALRPVVEPRRRGPGARPCVAHRPDPHRRVAPARVPRHRRRARRGGRRRQAPHRRPRAAEVELAVRPRPEQLRVALGLRPDQLLTEESM